GPDRLQPHPLPAQRGGGVRGISAASGLCAGTGAGQVGKPCLLCGAGGICGAFCPLWPPGLCCCRPAAHDAASGGVLLPGCSAAGAVCCLSLPLSAGGVWGKSPRPCPPHRHCSGGSALLPRQGGLPASGGSGAADPVQASGTAPSRPVEGRIPC